MLFVYVDDILALSHQTESVIKEIAQFFKTKEGSIKPPEIYLGANISTLQLPVKNRGVPQKNYSRFINVRNSSTCRTLGKNYTSMKRSF